MIDFIRKRLQTGILTEQSDAKQNDEIKQIKKEIKTLINKKFAGSLAIRMADSGSCNACEAECAALSNPYYNLESLGIYFVASPRHADVLLVSGVLTYNMYHHLLEAKEQVPSPKWIITLGDCPLMQSVFEKTYAIMAPVQDHMQVAHHIPGCPPQPDEIIKGLLDFLKNIK